MLFAYSHISTFLAKFSRGQLSGLFSIQQSFYDAFAYKCKKKKKINTRGVRVKKNLKLDKLNIKT